MIERFGAERYMRERGAKLVDDDPEWGKLWRVEVPGDEPIQMVEVIDATNVPGGQGQRAYHLRVPPVVGTARAAVSWTFDLPEADYEPAVQT